MAEQVHKDWLVPMQTRVEKTTRKEVKFAYVPVAVVVPGILSLQDILSCELRNRSNNFTAALGIRCT